MTIVYVTHDDIDRGVVGSQCRCPVALAMQRALSSNDIIVRSSHAYSNGFMFSLPPVVRQFIDQFDSRMPVYPFQFEIGLGNLDDSLTLTAHR